MARLTPRGRAWRLVLLLALAAWFFWPLWLAPDGLVYPAGGRYSDLTVTHWPNALFIRRALARSGQLPLWRPLILSGEPFAANPLAGLWYPPNLLLLILPLNAAFNLLFGLHTAWAGWGGYRLARLLGAGRAGAYLAAAAVAFAPRAVAHLSAGHVGLFCAWAWLPWTLWATRRLLQQGTPGTLAAAALCPALMALADVRMGVYGVALAGAEWLWCVAHSLRREGHPRVWPLLSRSVLAAGLGSALVAVQVLPLLAVAPRLSRGALSPAESAALALPPRYLAGLLVAPHGGNHEWMTYVGGVVLGLAVVGLLRWRGREKWWWAGVGLAAGVYALGNATPVYGLLLSSLPALGWLRVPARSWFVCALAAAMLAACGLTALERSPHAGRPGRARRWLSVGLGGAAVAGLGGGLALRLPDNITWAAFLWPLAALLIALGRARRASAVGVRWALLGLALADLWVCGLAQYRVDHPERAFSEGRAAAEWLAAQGGKWRVYSPSYSIPQHIGALFELESADGVDPFQLSAYSAFMRIATGVDGQGYSVTIPPFSGAVGDAEIAAMHRDVQPDLAWLGLLNVRYVASAFPMAVEGLTLRTEQDGVLIYENEALLPRAFVVERVAVATGQQDAFDWLAVHNPGEAAVVEGGPALDGPPGLREARLVDWTPNRIVVEAEGPGLLVLSEVHDPDWRAETGGQALPTVRVDGILRGVTLRPGLQRIQFVYRPSGLVAGAVISALGWLAVGVLALVDRRGRR